jgi:alkane 1-monooxygenase
VACPSALAAAAACLYGWRGLAFVVAQASIGVAMLEVVNYIEHYGLARAPRPGGG